MYNFHWDVGVSCKLKKFYYKRIGKRSKKLCGKLRHMTSYVTRIFTPCLEAQFYVEAITRQLAQQGDYFRTELIY